ncbi:Septum formation protein Maf [hydrothermal vent metagenome]|uniref:Septum formation protein Maf n=1 Tax=hydrothermal vent metagenome TaxID=652676 RepID=A0A3B0YD84_9ZZZZ
MADRVPDLYLCSQSPRRRELLSQMEVTYLLLDVEIDETPIHEESPQEYVARLAKEKAFKGWQCSSRLLNIPVLGADTTVVCNGEIMGKPLNEAQGLHMLTLQSGSLMQVFSAICLVNGKTLVQEMSQSSVLFRPLSSKEIKAYWSSGEPVDKAGGWAIQGKGAIFIKKLEGSYSGVMGLPIYETGECLKRFGIDCISGWTP